MVHLFVFNFPTEVHAVFCETPVEFQHEQQEIQRLQRVIAKVRFILTQLQQAIKGEVVMTEELQETLYAVYDAKVGAKRGNYR